MNKEEFDRLCEQWHEETKFRSDMPTDHPAFQAIVAAGKDVLPWIFNRVMFDDRAWWHLLAYDITGVDPCPEMARGRIYIQQAYWIVWGVEHGYITDDSINRDGCLTHAEGYFKLWQEALKI